MDSEDRKTVAVAFLEAAADGRARAAANRYVASGCRHHNPYFPAGMDELAKAMDEAAEENPAKRLEIQRVLGDGNLVAVHSRVTQNEEDLGGATVHLFRFEDDKIVEFWDIGQAVPEDMPNKDGMF